MGELRPYDLDSVAQYRREHPGTRKVLRFIDPNGSPYDLSNMHWVKEEKGSYRPKSVRTYRK